ncbi:glycerol-3-phosphate cytidylyltransferase [Acidisoma sp. 7E03]
MFGSRLIVGVSSDRFSFEKKGRFPIQSQAQRMEIVGAIRWVDDVFLEESFEQKREYLVARHANVLTMGDDWRGKFDVLSDVVRIVYLRRTPEVSTTGVVEQIRSFRAKRHQNANQGQQSNGR